MRKVWPRNRSWRRMLLDKRGGYDVTHLSVVLLEHVQEIKTSTSAWKRSQSRSAKINKSPSCVSCTDALYRFQSLGLWMMTASFFFSRIQTSFVAWLLLCSIMGDSKHSLIPLYFLIPAFLLVCWRVRKPIPGTTSFHPQTLAHSTHVLATASRGHLSFPSLTLWPLPSSTSLCELFSQESSRS